MNFGLPAPGGRECCGIRRLGTSRTRVLPGFALLGISEEGSGEIWAHAGTESRPRSGGSLPGGWAAGEALLSGGVQSAQTRVPDEGLHCVWGVSPVVAFPERRVALVDLLPKVWPCGSGAFPQRRLASLL